MSQHPTSRHPNIPPRLGLSSSSKQQQSSADPVLTCGIFQGSFTLRAGVPAGAAPTLGAPGPCPRAGIGTVPLTLPVSLCWDWNCPTQPSSVLGVGMIWKYPTHPSSVLVLGLGMSHSPFQCPWGGTQSWESRATLELRFGPANRARETPQHS